MSPFANPSLAPAPDTRRILVVDDDPDIADALATVLRLAMDCQVAVAHNGAEALDVAAQLRPDTILMDIRMPQVNGLEASGLFRTLFNRQPPRMIALTGWADAHDRAAIRACGFDELLTKPVDLDMLLRLLEQHPHRQAPAEVPG